jgi:uncharacterized protein (DUF169 family)
MTAPTQLQTLLGLKTIPVGLTFHATAPPNIPRVASAGPSGCSYWKGAADGQTFATEAPDHYNCPIGAYTHGVELPPAQTQELQNVVGTMLSLGYLRSEEVAGTPHRGERFGAAVYGPLTDTGAPPDVVLVRGKARQIMLLEEAAQAAGAGATAPLMGRPTCAAIPLALQTQRCVSSLGCIGNRVYTDLGDDEFYFALPGKHLAAIVGKLTTIVEANRKLEDYHRARKTTVGASV